MLEVRYIEGTGVITAWAGSPRHKGGHLEPRDDEKIIVIDCPNPIYSSENYLVANGQLGLTKEPEPPRDYGVEIDEMKTRLDKVELR